MLVTTRNVGQIINTLIELYPEKKKELGKIVSKLLKQPSLSELFSNQEEEFEMYKSAKEFLEKEFNTSFEVIKAEESDNSKAKIATPGKIGILIE